MDPAQIKEDPTANSADPVPTIEAESHADEVAAALSLIGDGGPAETPEAEAPASEPVQPDAEDAPPPQETAPAQPTAEAEAPQEAPAGSEAKGWAAIRQQEKKLRDERQDFRAEQHRFKQEMEQLRGEMAQNQASLNQVRQAFAQDPYGTIERTFGVPFNELVRAASSGQQTVQPQQNGRDNPVLQRLAQLEATIHQNQVNSQLNVYKSGISEVMKTEQFELLRNVPNAEQEVLDFATGYFTKYGEALSPADAASRIQDEYRATLRSLAANEVARRELGLGPTDTQQPAASPNPPPSSQGPKTLTNTQQAAPPRQNVKDLSPMSDDEEVKAALKLVDENVWDRME